MAESLGSGVSRTLSALRRQYVGVVFQPSKPPLDAEYNLQDAVHTEQRQQLVRSAAHSGFFVDPTQANADFVTDPQWSNLFEFGRNVSGELAPIVWANVNGWTIPVVGTGQPEGTASNLVMLASPPASDSRIDLVFLEAWAAVVAPNPSTVNKPSASTIWTYGNVEYGGTNITDDIEDPTIGFETTERVQIQYRIRVYGSGAGLGASVALDVYPDGLGDPNVLGQGTSDSPVAGTAFTNMREALGDPNLWRAGDGDPGNDLGTVDGYTYAIPICAVFRRNSSPFEAVEPSGNANQNGALDRNPSAATLADPRDGAKVLVQGTLTNPISETATGAIAITNLTDSGFDDADIDLASTFVVIDGEVLGPLTAVGASTITVGTSARGRNGTMAVPHEAGASVSFFNPRPDGLFADQVASTDVLDLRRGITLGEWDYARVLVHNLSALVQGRMRTSYKQSSSTETQGLQVVEVSYLLADGATAVPPATTAVDGPDGIRTVFSDSAAIQPGVTVLCDDAATQSSGLVSNFETSGSPWEVGATFAPSGFMTSTSGFRNGSTVFLHIGGTTGNDGARGTFRDSGTNAVRFVSPAEFWKTDLPDETTGLQHPITARWLGVGATQPAAYGESSAAHPGPMYPTKATNFEKPFIVLGGILNDDSQVGGATVYNAPNVEVDLPGFDFDTVGIWRQSDITSLDPSGLSHPVLRGQRTLYSLLTQDGRDRTGNSSEVYLVLYGDNVNADNNGAFQVIGAGTAGYTTQSASASDRIRVRPLTAGITTFPASPGVTLTAELRSQHTNAEDGTGSASDPASLAVVFTDIAGATSGSPWASLVTQPVASQLVLSTALLYHPGRGATARVADEVWRIAGVNLGAEYLRQAPGSLDSTFPSAAGVPGNETYFDVQHVQGWNRLTSLGLGAPDAPDYGGGVFASSEQSREAEAFIDRGSKTLIFRPFLDRSMTLVSRTSSASAGNTLLGLATYSNPNPPPATITKDGAGIWTTGLHRGFEVPPEFMPRFGRQDIPYYDTDVGTGTFLPGINHLFKDTNTTTATQLAIIGGEDNGGTAGVSRFLVQTGSASGLDYGQWGTVTGTGYLGYQGRITSQDGVISSDLGRGMKGIQLPPYIGIARLYGVYDRRDFVSKGGATFNSDRVTPASDPATNLLRRDAHKQTLFILRDGAEDVTGETGDHTYIVPSDAIDIRLSPQYVDGETFEDLDFVVEFCAFGFAKDFINGNNYVLARRHTGSGTSVSDADPASELANCHMVIPAPAPLNDSLYVGYTRTPYQGDPYMTRAGSSRTVTDYTARYGQVPIASQYLLTSSIQQFDGAGDLIPQTPNRRSLEVLAGLDFYTTLGTGKIGGSLYAGTPLDAGYTEPDGASRLPSSSSAPGWRVLPRAFSEGQRANASHARLGVEILNNGTVSAKTVTVTVPGQTAVILTAGVDFAVGGSASATATNLAAAIVANATLGQFLKASTSGTTVATLVAKDVGAAGNGILVAISDPTALGLNVDLPAGSLTSLTSAYLSGGVDLAVNAGNGTSQIDLTGMTDRLPLGILLQDSDFICENPLGDNASAFATEPQGIRPVQSLLPLAAGGQEYTRLLAGPGQWIGLADGGILQYEAYNADTAPTGTQKFRLYRGGGSAFVLSEPTPGGPIDWVSGSFPASLHPVLKGGVLVCKALLVRNLHEEAFSLSNTVSEGDELQMVVLTYGILGRGDTQDTGVNLSGVISPTGYGEGYAAADRYRLEGRPSVPGRARALATADAEPAVFPGQGAQPPE